MLLPPNILLLVRFLCTIQVQSKPPNEFVNPACLRTESSVRSKTRLAAVLYQYHRAFSRLILGTEIVCSGIRSQHRWGVTSFSNVLPRLTVCFRIDCLTKRQASFGPVAGQGKRDNRLTTAHRVKIRSLAAPAALGSPIFEEVPCFGPFLSRRTSLMIVFKSVSNVMPAASRSSC